MPDIQNYSTFWEHLWQTVKTVGATSIFKILLAVAILMCLNLRSVHCL